MDTRTKQIKKDMENRITYNLLRDKYTEEELIEASDDFIESNSGEEKRIDIRYNLQNGYCEMYGDAMVGVDEDEEGYTIREDNSEVRYYNDAHERD